MLMDNGWYRMLRNAHVSLHDEQIAGVEGQDIVLASGERHTVDVLVICTGFDVLNFGTAFDLVGRTGCSLRERWGDDGRAFLGTAVPEFPNFFMLYGPNTQPGHGGSLLFVIEMQLRYIMSVVQQMSAGDFKSVEVKASVHDEYNEAVDAAHEKMVWTHPGMQTYYRNSQGRVVVNYPWRNVDLFAMTQSADLQQFETH